MCERELETETELQHIDPHSYGHNRVSFPFSWAAYPGAWGPSLSGCCSSFQHLLSNCNCSIGGPEGPFCWVLFSLRHHFSNCNCLIGGLRAHSAGCWLSLLHLVSNWLNFLCTELYNSSTSTFFLSVSQIALIQPVHDQGYILIFLDRMHRLFTQVHFLFWQPGRVGGQYTTITLNFKKYPQTIQL